MMLGQRTTCPVCTQPVRHAHLTSAHHAPDETPGATLTAPSDVTVTIDRDPAIDGTIVIRDLATGRADELPTPTAGAHRIHTCNR